MSTRHAVTNEHNVPLALAVWLLADDYDYVNEPNYISVTSLLKPLRQIVLSHRVPHDMKKAADVSDFLARRMGQSLHNSIEHAWLHKYKQSLSLLGYPDQVINKVVINPTKEQLLADPDAIPIYLEKRDTKRVGKWLIESIFRRDYPALQGGVLLVSTLLVMVNLAVDVLNAAINPRIRHA